MPLRSGLAALLVLLLTACESSPGPDAATGGLSPRGTPFVSAHRGGAGYAPEDTRSAYRNAARLGVDDFET
ncbi:hypothetical protein ABTA85_19725, partial [Acinetobacter baumannii]